MFVFLNCMFHVTNIVVSLFMSRLKNLHFGTYLATKRVQLRVPIEENKCLFSPNYIDDQDADDLQFILRRLNTAIMNGS